MGYRWGPWRTSGGERLGWAKPEGLDGGAQPVIVTPVADAGVHLSVWVFAAPGEPG